MDRRLVIARAFQGEPLKMAVVSIGDNSIYLANPDQLGRVNSGDPAPVGFPRDDVYEFDETLFSGLRT